MSWRLMPLCEAQKLEKHELIEMRRIATLALALFPRRECTVQFILVLFPNRADMGR